MSLTSGRIDVHNPANVRALQQRIGWLCQTGRVLAAAYAVWTLWLTVSFWLGPAGAARRFTMIAGTGPEPLSAGMQITGLALSLVAWLLVASACFSAWRLFSSYLEGRIFTPGAAHLMRRAALLGIGAVLFDVAMRPALLLLVTGTLPAYTKASYYYFSPHDLALLLFLVSLFAIAHIFKVAAELAEENAEIL